MNSINEFLHGSDDVTYAEVIPDEQATSSYAEVIDRIHQEQLRNDILQMLDQVFGGEFYFDGYVMKGDLNAISLLDKLKNGITPKEIILLHYGLKSETMSFKSIAEIVGVSASWI